MTSIGLTRRSVLASLTVAAFTGISKRAMAAEPILLGMTTALTGPFSEFGEGMRRGAELAVAQINKNGGVMGRPIQFGYMLDDQLIADRAVQNMRRILDDKSVAGIICPSGSGPTLAIADIVAADGRPIINAQAQTPSVTYPDASGKPRFNMFSVAVQNDVDAQFMGAVLAKSFKRIGLLHESTAYGKSGGNLIREQIQSLKKDAEVFQESYNQKDQDMTAELVRIRRGNAEVICVVGLGSDLAVVRKTMARMGLQLPIYCLSGGITAPYVEGAGDLVLGTRGSSAKKISLTPPTPETATLLTAYEAKYGKDRWWGPDETPQPTMSTTIGSPYDAVGLFADAFKRAGSIEPAATIKALEQTKGFTGAVGDYSFSPERHHSVGPADLGLFEYVREDGRIKLKPVAG